MTAHARGGSVSGAITEKSRENRILAGAHVAQPRPASETLASSRLTLSLTVLIMIVLARFVRTLHLKC